ncbi:predicted protein [Naegleria gruberi]|uniref:Predicted protein n=1 Tax=Naegleria gruberi TaxID=5762 RepID=D2VH62_NAEGR|nr:uncharacterized protein NAEGRDRAFT_68288 [Naegleria gruberi]EFC43837.1 predicted protein [Naegleria gruberi]|eukprot:XP_002676581.1 predicted protein [Naegleria gruberi strain NEG-M]
MSVKTKASLPSQESSNSSSQKFLIISGLLLGFSIVFRFVNRQLDSETNQSFFGDIINVFSSFLFTVLLIMFSLCILMCSILFLLLFRKGKPTHIQSSNAGIDISSKVIVSEKAINDINDESVFFVREQESDDGDCKWLNIILNRVLQQYFYKNASKIKKQILQKVSEEMKLPDFVGDLQIKDLNFGSKSPYFKTISAKEDRNGLQVDIAVVYDDPKTKIHLGTEIWINYPVKRFASFPIQFAIENIFLDAKMRVILSPDFKLLKFCFLKQPNFDLIFSNEFGHHSSLQNLPILTDIINRQIYLLLSETLVAPNFIEIPIPEPSEKKTKKSEQEDEADVQADNGEYSSDDLESNNDDELSSRGSDDEDTIEEDQSRQRITNRKTKRSTTRPTSNKK